MTDGPKVLQDLLAALKDSIAAEAHAREMAMQVSSVCLQLHELQLLRMCMGQLKGHLS